jgi:hypothetical protein
LEKCLARFAQFNIGFDDDFHRSTCMLLRYGGTQHSPECGIIAGTTPERYLVPVLTALIDTQ